MSGNKKVTEGDILKGILRQRRITQEQLAPMVNYGRTKLNMAMGLDILPDELKEKVIKALDLPADTFPVRVENEAQEVSPVGLIPDLMKKVDQVLAQQAQMLAQQNQILKLLQKG